MDNDSILTSIVPITGAIYRSGREKPDIKWNFEVKLSADDIVLSQFKNRLQFFLGVKQRCEELNIDKFTLKLLNMKSAPKRAVNGGPGACPLENVLELRPSERQKTPLFGRPT